MRNRTRITVAALAAVAVIVAVMKTASTVTWCPQMSALEPIDNSTRCASQPGNPRVLGVQNFEWGGVPYFIINRGNEIDIWDMSNPEVPDYQTGSRFRVPNQGDSDYDLMAVAVCDDCQYGAAWYKMGAVVFDLGTGAVPSFGDFEYTGGATNGFGGFTYLDASVGQVLISSAWPNGNTITTMWQVCGINSMVPLQSVPSANEIADDGRPEVPNSIAIAGGTDLHNGYVLLGDSNTKVHLFRQTLGGLSYVSQPFLAPYGKMRGVAIDGSYLVQVNYMGAAVWDIGTPGTLTKLGDIPGSYSKGHIAISGRLVFVCNSGVDGSEAVFSIDDPSAPVEIHPEFWNGSLPWNGTEGQDCSAVYAGAWADDTLHLMRYSIWQIVEDGDCDPPPVASIFYDGFESGDTTSW